MKTRDALCFILPLAITLGCRAAAPETEAPMVTCPGDVHIRSRAAIASFRCDAVEGTLLVSGADFTDLDWPSFPQSVGGSLVVYENPMLTNLAGFERLEVVGGELDIRFNPQLRNVDGLAALKDVGHIRIAENHSLENVDGLANVASFSGRGYRGVWIESNSILAEVDGLLGITVVPGEIRLNNNPSMANVAGLGRVTAAHGGLSLRDNATLTSLEGLTNLISLGGWLRIARNPALTTLDGLESLTTANNIEIGQNPMLTDAEALRSLTTISGELHIHDNPELSQTETIRRLFAIAGSITAQVNPAGSMSPIWTAFALGVQSPLGAPRPRQTFLRN